MKNIHTILSEYGITIPEDKKAEFDKAVAENYKTSAEHEKKVNRLTEDLTAEKKRADTAVETLKGFEGKDFDAITRERDEWKRKHDEQEAAHKKEQEERELNEAVSALIDGVKFTSPAAKRDVVRQLKEKGLKAILLSGEEALGSIRNAEPESFVDDLEEHKAKFTTRKGSGNTGGGKKLSDMTLDERIQLKKNNPKLYESMKKENK